MKERRTVLSIILLVLITLMTIMTLSGCGTSGKVYNVGTGELIEKR
tara:strand:+ start:6719 stop:6856 length:138 start_codon:yes stop_codon:yes gene_type:complete